MAEDNDDDVVLPALLRAARNTYGSAMRAAMAEVDCDDVPRNGIYVLGGIARTGSPLSQIIRQLRLSKQAASQLVDTLVARGYLDRSPDPADRRRMTVSLTERGHGAAQAARSAARAVDEELVARLDAEHVAHTRATLEALIEIGEDASSGHVRAYSPAAARTSAGNSEISNT
jgi:DNA-binding MarR family transcriptional regulator